MNAKENLRSIEEWLATMDPLEQRIGEHEVIGVAIVGMVLAFENLVTKRAAQVKAPPSSAVLNAAQALGVKPYASDCEIVLAYRRAGSQLKPRKREADFERLVALRAARDMLLAESIRLLAPQAEPPPLASVPGLGDLVLRWMQARAS